MTLLFVNKKLKKYVLFQRQSKYALKSCKNDKKTPFIIFFLFDFDTKV